MLLGQENVGVRNQTIKWATWWNFVPTDILLVDEIAYILNVSRIWGLLFCKNKIQRRKHSNVVTGRFYYKSVEHRSRKQEFVTNFSSHWNLLKFLLTQISETEILAWLVVYHLRFVLSSTDDLTYQDTAT